MFKCQRCGNPFEAEWVGDSENGFLQDKLCYPCFEDGVEEADERRRERIALANEY